jgi:hypothetical protein
LAGAGASPPSPSLWDDVATGRDAVALVEKGAPFGLLRGAVLVESGTVGSDDVLVDIALDTELREAGRRESPQGTTVDAVTFELDRVAIVGWAQSTHPYGNVGGSPRIQRLRRSGGNVLPQ